MGVHGLTTFVDQTKGLLKDYRLHDTKLVIDGHNLFHFIYCFFNVQAKYGGDYDNFASRIRYVFELFQRCNVQAYVVLDGAYSEDNRKLRTVMERLRDRIRVAGLMSSGRGGKLTPILAYDTFLHVLREMRVPHATCDLEADDQIAVLANEWQCPVLSNDSDFFVFDLKGGFVLIDYVVFEAAKHKGKGQCELSYSYIAAQIYSTENFSECFKGFTSDMLPFMALLLGNDYINTKQFDTFFSRQHYGKYSGKQKNNKQLVLIEWLTAMSTTDKAIDSILSAIKLGNRSEIKSRILQTIDEYSHPKFSFNLKQFFESDCSKIDSSSSIATYLSLSLPDWLIAMFRQSHIDQSVLNAVTLQRVLLPCQTEQIKDESSYTCSERLRAIMYGILLKDVIRKKLTDDESTKEIAGDMCVEEVRRETKNVKKFYVKPIYSLPEYGVLPGTSELMDLSVSQRRAILAEACDVNSAFLASFPVRIQLLIACIVFCVKHASPALNDCHVKALMVCAIYLKLKSLSKHDISNKLIPGDNEKSEKDGQQYILDISKACRTASKEQIHSAISNLNKYGKEVEARRSHKTGTQLLQMDIIHGFAQYQTCYLAASQLNRFLICPVEDINPAKLINATFLYHMCKELQYRSMPDAYMKEILGQSSPIAYVYESIGNRLVEHFAAIGDLGPLHIDNSKRLGRKKRTRSGKRKSSNKTSEFGQDVEINIDSGVHVVEEDIVLGCDVSNKFSQLAIS